MAKGQKKSTREVRKPKADKAATQKAAPLFANGSLTPAPSGKQKA
ncbi:hypothetical protein [Asticcacaulis sp. EMRT-3]|nr:hypothetical protein [Asticcacaulis sp. EMRT-3]MDI7776169.1 hypothetical protein [Asticcacaulis sp. EMRT-3]